MRLIGRSGFVGVGILFTLQNLLIVGMYFHESASSDLCKMLDI